MQQSPRKLKIVDFDANNIFSVMMLECGIKKNNSPHIPK